MKNIIYFLNEALIKKDTKILSKKDILNKEVYSLDDIADILVKYFKLPKKPKISKMTKSFKFPDSKSGILVYEYFIITFEDKYKIQVGLHHGYILVQCLIKTFTLQGRPKWATGKIHGSKQLSLKLGNNFLDFIMKIKKATDENDWSERDENLIKIFKLDE